MLTPFKTIFANILIQNLLVTVCMQYTATLFSLFECNRLIGFQRKAAVVAHYLKAIWVLFHTLNMLNTLQENQGICSCFRGDKNKKTGLFCLQVFIFHQKLIC